jgi:hypothetical protein
MMKNMRLSMVIIVHTMERRKKYKGMKGMNNESDGENNNINILTCLS